MVIEEIKFEDKVETLDWEAYVRSEVSALLETFLPISTAGCVGISYNREEEGTLESGEVIYNENKVVGVNILLSFDFGGKIDKPI